MCAAFFKGLVPSLRDTGGAGWRKAGVRLWVCPPVHLAMPSLVAKCVERQPCTAMELVVCRRPRVHPSQAPLCTPRVHRACCAPLVCTPGLTPSWHVAVRSVRDGCRYGTVPLVDRFKYVARCTSPETPRPTATALAALESSEN